MRRLISKLSAAWLRLRDATRASLSQPPKVASSAAAIRMRFMVGAPFGVVPCYRQGGGLGVAVAGFQLLALVLRRELNVFQVGLALTWGSGHVIGQFLDCVDDLLFVHREFSSSIF